jgi:Domain of unknown function (DUF4157)
MKLTAAGQAHMERFFRYYLRDARLRLPVVLIHANQWTRTLTKPFRFGAITFGRHVFVGTNLVARDGDGRMRVPGWLLAHELMHVIQYERAGMRRFLSAYLREYAQAMRRGRKLNATGHWLAYRAITQETEAYAAEAAYRQWSECVETLMLR